VIFQHRTAFEVAGPRPGGLLIPAWSEDERWSSLKKIHFTAFCAIAKRWHNM
jgi:hypothetical protein